MFNNKTWPNREKRNVKHGKQSAYIHYPSASTNPHETN